LAINRITDVGELLSELPPQAIVARMQESHKNGQDNSDTVEASKPFTITRAALNSTLFHQQTVTGLS